MNEVKKAKGSIFRRLFIIILTVFIAELCLFAFSLGMATSKLVEDVTNIRLEEYLKSAQLLDDPYGMVETPAGYGIESIIFKSSDDEPQISEGARELLTEEEIEQIINAASKASFLEIQHGFINHKTGKVYFAYTASSYDTIFIGVCSDDYLNSSIMNLVIIVVILYTSIFLAAASSASTLAC